MATNYRECSREPSFYGILLNHASSEILFILQPPLILYWELDISKECATQLRKALRTIPEERMSSNILALPFRRTHTVSLSEALKVYISENYDQHPDMFKQDLEAIDRFRQEAVTAATTDPHSSAIKKISAYAAQLVWIGGKFPIDIGVQFTWYSALGGFYQTQNGISEGNLRYELANVLFNLAATYSQLALSLNRTTAEGLKLASGYLCQAAGVVKYLKTDVVPDMRISPAPDMDEMTLESIQLLLLAQAQECSWSMAIKNGYKDALIAKLAAQVSDFYDQAAEYGTRSDTISTDWIHHMSAKHHHFAAAAQYRAACDCLEKRKYGEEVARLKDSLVCVNEALKEKRWINQVVLGDLNGLKMKVTDDLRRAEQDNDMIYLQNVTPKSELKPLDRVPMAVPKEPSEISDPATSLGDKGIFGQPLFVRLVPYAVHIAASIYADRKERLVHNQIIEELEALNNRLKDLLASLNLPGALQALEKPLGLPSSVLAHAEEIRQQQGLHKLRRSMRELDTIKENDLTLYKEGVSLLEAEAAEDSQARLKYGTERWTRPVGQISAHGIYKQVSEIDGYLKSADASDDLVRKKFKEVENVIRVLEGTDRDIEDFVPSSRRSTMTPNMEREALQLRNVLNEISRTDSRRRKQIEAVREKSKADDIHPMLLTETARLEREFPMQPIEAIQFEDLFDTRLERYKSDLKMVQDEKIEQEQLASKLRSANTAFASTRSGDTSSKDRERALQKLETGYVKYKEILSNLDTGRKFYNDLAKIVNRFRDECRDFKYQRRMEAGQVENDLSNAMSALSMAQSNSLQDQRERESLRSQYNATKAASGEPLAAPMPTRSNPPAPAGGMWTPDMGIKFSATPVSSTQENAHNPAYPAPTTTQQSRGVWNPSGGITFGQTR